ncbi:hypothetical protein L207DRAFT_91802 [Hyaloscypha variabilis F]|uniref:Uncharacterized protein n=1 Tax=Hyaloscypha variabilis (strain UAMH 11265 / GT02V1 / F) TaxID=1149755 RepID=A0A2J6REH6_HYAVF|nr:hypothetical protein L207DRAFT_91802 [Hyaloscypha variabilis F]
MRCQVQPSPTYCILEISYSPTELLQSPSNLGHTSGKLVSICQLHLYSRFCFWSRNRKRRWGSGAASPALHKFPCVRISVAPAPGDPPRATHSTSKRNLTVDHSDVELICWEMVARFMRGGAALRCQTEMLGAKTLR